MLTGGTGRRLGGADKASLELAGRTLLTHVLSLLAALPRVVVGEPVPGERAVREQPPGGGPAAALLAGVEALPPEVDVVLALAVDMPLVTAGTLQRLLAAADGEEGSLLVDAAGRRQFLCAAYARDALVAAAPAEPADRAGLPLRRLVSGLRLAEVAALGHEAHDVDTWDDLEQARTWLRSR